LNVGTPDAPETGPVRRYLRQFLSDPRVLDIHPVGRFLLLNVAILPFRPAKSARAYKKVWLPEGSPLKVHALALAAAIGQRLGPHVPVQAAMAYGNPSIPFALQQLRDQHVDRVVAVPLYPQYAASSTGAAMEATFREMSKLWAVPAISSVGPFWNRPEFLDSFAGVARPVLDAFRPDHVLFSFHGLPERHMRKADDSGSHCLKRADCCATITAVNRNCYRAQCFATARLLSERLEIPDDRRTVSFQSRLGRTPWIQPYTDQVLPKLASQGFKRVAVLCPAFVADCLETLEEIGIRARDDFRSAGGEDLALIPSLNSHPDWVDGLARIVSEHL
jgi:ferrochelatase